jgi:protein-tyrosine phosphatase
MVAYLMGRKQINLKDALELVISKRPIAEPNPGFML